MSAPVELLVCWFRDAASCARAKHKGEQIIFPVVLRARILLVGAIVFESICALLLFRGGESIALRTFLCLITIWLVNFWPWQVVLDRDGVVKRNYFGVKKSILWFDVSAFIYRERSEEYILVGRDGTKIVFSSFHVDPAGFEAEVLKSSQVKRVETTDPIRDPFSPRKRPLT